MWNFLLKYNDITRASIIASIIVAMIVIVLIIVYFLPDMKKRHFKYFYAFTAGFIVIVGFLGLYASIKTYLSEAPMFDKYDMEYFGGIPTKSEDLDIFGQVINKRLFTIFSLAFTTITSLLAIGIVVIIKHFMHRKMHNNVDGDKISSIVLVLLHRVPASFIIGAFASDPVTEESALFAIILHIIPEVLLVYYRQIDAGVTKKKAFLYSLLVKLVFFPLILIGSALNTVMTSLWWFKPLLFAMGGTFMVYAGVHEFALEFVREVKQDGELLKVSSGESATNIKKRIFLTTLCLVIGVSLAAGIMSFHYH